MENVEIDKTLFGGVFENKTVLVTGHTGFKGSWLSYWLSEIGSNVIGYSSSIMTEPSHYDILGLSTKINDIRGDVRDLHKLNEVFTSYKPDIVYHLAAQSLVRPSYRYPAETFTTNIVGTANVLECVRSHDFVTGIVNVTSDKCYENFEDDRAYAEDNRMGGYDPYSASKGAAELVANSYRSSFFNPLSYGERHNVLLASARAGNVIGGGDWSDNRLIPDMIKTAIKNEITSIRSPRSTRPWQHVLEPLSGYLLIGQRILEREVSISDSWNLGPLNNETLPVSDVVTLSSNAWNKIKYQFETIDETMHEAKLLRLDCTKANQNLNWSPVWDAKEAITKTIRWYQSFYEEDVCLTENQLLDYIDEAKKMKKEWAQ